MLFYRAALPLSRKTLDSWRGSSAATEGHRVAWRKLNPGQQALVVLAYLRKGETFAELAAGSAFGDHCLEIRERDRRTARRPRPETPHRGP